jgi:hypothetical protein
MLQSRESLPRRRRVVRTSAGLAALLAACLFAPLALAQTQSQVPGATEAPPALEPKAMEVLKAASAALAGANTLSFTAISTYERAANNGQPLYYSSVHQVTMQRPDKLRVITPGDGTPDEFYYDGKTMMAYVPGSDLVAVADAPPTIDELIDEAWDKAAIYFPFSDIIASDPYAELSKTLKSAFYVGRSIAIGGTTTDMIALAGDEVAGEVWIGVDDHLPRMVRVVYANEPAHARYSTEFSNWKLGEPVAAGAFASERAAKAKRMEFAPPGDAEPPKDVK